MPRGTSPIDPRTTPRLSVVTPCYNEEGSIAEFHRRVSPACAAAVGQNYEIVLVNDGSKDPTWAKIVALCAEDPHVAGVNLSRNHGYQLALSAGLSVCKGERILIIDADLQDSPEALGMLMAKMDEGCDVVYGQRTERLGETWAKRATAKLFYRMLRALSDTDIPLDTGYFRLMSWRTLDILLAMPEHHRFIRGMISWIGLRQEALPYQRSPRFASETSYSWARMIRFGIDAVTGFSVRPLRVASYQGMLACLFSFLVFVYVLWNWLAGAVVPGWTSLMAIMLLLGSAQLIVMGIFGEYLGRRYIEAKGRPMFVIKRTVRQGDHDASERRRHDLDQGDDDEIGERQARQMEHQEHRVAVPSEPRNRGAEKTFARLDTVTTCG
jgi:glycosyltransferase involved in cell wall biosynthesis